MPASAPAASAFSHRVPGLFLRLSSAALAVFTFFIVSGQLDPAPLVAARFALGLVLLAVLVDIGRALAGAGPPLVGDLRPHVQRAEPLVDDEYRALHTRVRAFIDDGQWNEQFGALLDEALAQRGVPRVERERALSEARASATGTPHQLRPLALALASGGVLVVGISVAAGVLFEAAGVPLAGPLFVIVGIGTYGLQARAIAAGSRWAAVVAGLFGALLAYLGARGLTAAHGSGWRLLEWGCLVLALLAVGLAFWLSPDRAAWREARLRLRQELVTLRRAFLVTFALGLVLFPFEPLLGAVFDAFSWTFDVPYRMLVITWVTVASFLALELAGAWLALDRGERQARSLRQSRVDAQERILRLLEARAARSRRGETA